MTNIQSKTNLLHRVLSVKHLTTSTFIIQIERNELEFTPGQHLSVSTEHEAIAREYSIYSGSHQPFIELLIREVEDGSVSKRLKNSKPGDYLRIVGPFGHFKIENPEKKQLFVATGTGISPFHSFVASYPQIDYQLIHGVRLANEAYERSFYGDRYTLCTSREAIGDFKGRVTQYLKAKSIDRDTQVYLCGSTDMIFEMFEILNQKGIPTQQIQTEIYF